MFEGGGGVFHGVRQLVAVQLEMAEKRHLVESILNKKHRTKTREYKFFWIFNHLLKGVGSINVTNLVVPVILLDEETIK